ncbi:MAG: crotonase/enoyl-CoA hydratase family protein [Deltaproteobacteria bacterium]|nr:crotonase/enoyl-CoA hydratase family protein [Deltaproteobacteria bacterium]
MSAEPASGASEARITREARGHVLLIGFNRPAKKNAFDLVMWRELVTAFTELDRNPELRCGLVFAHGPAFTAGLDLANVAPAVATGEFPGTADAIDPFATHGARVSKPVVCAVHGLCLTLGIELMLACDIRVAAEGARFGQIEVKRGIFPFGGGCARWVTACGWGNAMRYLLTGDEFDAQEALRIGLVQEVVPPERLLPRALELAETVAAQAPLAVQATLRNARLANEGGAALAARELMPEILRLMASEDAVEGLRSFVERRAAKFTGR